MAEERSRVAEERVAKEQRERAEAAERDSRVRIRLEEEALREARERDRLLEEERRRREEQARLEGIQAAEVARIRDEAMLKAAAERALVEREHELKLAGIRQAASARATRWALGGTSAGMVVACAALVWLELGVHPVRLAALQTEYAGLTASERARADRAEGMLRTADAKRRELEEALRARAAAPPLPTPAPTTRTPPSRRATRVPPRTPGTRPPPTPCDENDPLDPCLAPRKR